MARSKSTASAQPVHLGQRGGHVDRPSRPGVRASLVGVRAPVRTEQGGAARLVGEDGQAAGAGGKGSLGGAFWRARLRGVHEGVAEAVQALRPGGHAVHPALCWRPAGHVADPERDRGFECHGQVDGAVRVDLGGGAHQHPPLSVV
jgi:hypothetical protein